MWRYGSCETSRIDDSEGVERQFDIYEKVEEPKANI